MKENFFANLTSEIRDEVMERYVTERRIAELQIDNLHTRAEEAWTLARETSRRLTRLGYWMIDSETRRRIVAILKVPNDSPWRESLDQAHPYELHSIAVSAFRNRAKLRKLLIKAYERASLWMDRYRNAYENLKAECEAVKTNIRSFENSFSLQTVLGFLKSLNGHFADKTGILGGNFKAEEIASVECSLAFRVPSVEDFNLPVPLSLPEPRMIEHLLSQLADGIFDRHQSQVKEMMESLRSKGY